MATTLTGKVALVTGGFAQHRRGDRKAASARWRCGGVDLQRVAGQSR
jgi:hypothetical protein